MNCRGRECRDRVIALGVYFGQTPEFWMNAQKTYELSKELIENGEKICAGIRQSCQDSSSYVSYLRNST